MWDNECVGCVDSCYQYDIPPEDRIEGGPVLELNCMLPKIACDNDPAECDPEIFISWMGTDIKHNTMYSAGMTFSLYTLLITIG